MPDTVQSNPPPPQVEAKLHVPVTSGDGAVPHEAKGMTLANVSIRRRYNAITQPSNPNG